MSLSLKNTDRSHPDGDLLDITQLLKKVLVSKRTIATWRTDGIIPFTKHNGVVLFSWKAVSDALDRKGIKHK